MATAIAKDVCGIAKSVRGGRPAKKERIEWRDRMVKRGRDTKTEEEILVRGYRLGSLAILAALALPVRRHSVRVASGRSSRSRDAQLAAESPSVSRDRFAVSVEFLVSSGE